MTPNFNFCAASPAERIVYGARKPEGSNEGVALWISFMREQGIERVCCLLDSAQRNTYKTDLQSEYEKHFGSSNVLMAPIQDYHLCDKDTLQKKILPFLQESNALGRSVVVHCWGGNGRTGHVLAAWLVAARGLSPMDAITTVEATGRKPREAVEVGNATLDELLELLGSCAPGGAV